MAFFYPEPVSDTRDRQKKQQHIAAIRRYFLILVLIIALFSICFHFLMIYEGQQQTWLSGVYWCLTVMTTLGFGDITFTTDLGRIFSVLVLLVGLVYFAILLPFTFMQHVYRPWSERQLRERVPHSLPPEATCSATESGPFSSATTRRPPCPSSNAAMNAPAASTMTRAPTRPCARTKPHSLSPWTRI